MYNKKAISEALAKLNKAKAPKQEPDIIYSPRGQWDHPGEVTRVPSENITMQGVHTPLLGIDNMGNQQMMYPGAEYTFPGADYVDEYPMMQSGGQRPTIYVDPNDPEGRARYQAYDDSLQAFNITNSRFDHPNAYHKKSKRYGLYINPEYKERDTKTENKFIEDFIKKGNKAQWKTYPLYKDQTEEELLYPVNSYIEYGSFKKPVQPIKYKPDPEIVAKQQQLINAGFNIGKADGIWGPKSQAAWEQMQTKQQEVPTKSVDNLDEQVETVTPIRQRKEEPTGITRQVPKSQWKQLPDGTWYKDTKAGIKASVEDTGLDIGGRKLRYGGLTTGLTNTKGNLLMNNKGKRMMAQSGSLSATNELFLGNPLVTKRKRAVFVPGHDFQRGGAIDLELTPEEIKWYKSQGYNVEEL